MKIYSFLVLSILFSISCTKNQEEKPLVDYVNVYIGTTGEHAQDYGGTLPSVTQPFGMTQWCPMTRENEISVNPYHYDDSTIIGFIGTHQPAIWMGDYGFVSIMPQTGKPKIKPDERALPFSHAHEKVSPNFYSVQMGYENHKINVELAASMRCSIFKIHYTEKDSANLSIEISREKKYPGWLKILPDQKTIIGYSSDRQSSLWGMDEISAELKNFKGYFVIQFDKQIQRYATWAYINSSENNDSSIIELKYDNVECSANRLGVYASFGQLNNENLKVKISTSFVSIDQAYKNLEKEIPEWDFEKVVSDTKDIWEMYLNRVKVKGGTKDEKTSFYTAMYHSLLFPRIFSEYGKYYSAADDTVHNGDEAYNDYSLWDTFRALHPWLTIAAPEHVSPMITSMLQMYNEGGWLPMWPNPGETNIMLGTHSDAVIADAVVKGFAGFDIDLAYQAMYKNATITPHNDINNEWIERSAWTSNEARGGLIWYKILGYVPSDKVYWNASKTIEFSYNDYCVAKVAAQLGKTDDAALFFERSKYYKNQFDTETGFMRGRLSNGDFSDDLVYVTKGKEKIPLNPFSEGNHWEYLFGAMHDIPGLVELMGGNEAFDKKLDETFYGGHNRHQNEPSHHYAYLYNYCGKAYKTQERTRIIMDSLYFNAPDGLCGNDDCGQMSAWYLFSALGFYPVAPGSGEYAIGSPIFSEVTIKLRKPYREHEVTIIANNVSKKNKYINSVSIDGKKIDKPFLIHSDLVTCRRIVFEMAEKPNKH